MKIHRVEKREDCPVANMTSAGRVYCPRLQARICPGPDSKDCPLEDMPSLSNDELTKMYVSVDRICDRCVYGDNHDSCRNFGVGVIERPCPRWREKK